MLLSSALGVVFEATRNEFERALENPYLFGSLVFCVIVHHVISPIIFRNNIAYKKLTKVEQMEWDSRLVSTIHAAAVSVLCVYALAFDRQLWNDPILYRSQIGLTILSLSIGYFICDLISMPIYWWSKDLAIFIVHHLAAIVAFQKILQYKMCIFFGVFRLTTELSTPFTNQRWFYRMIGYKPEKRRVAMVSLIFSILFFVTRNAMSIPFWYISLRARNSEAHAACVADVPSLDIFFAVPCIILDCLNAYWGIRAFRLGKRAFCRLRQAEWAEVRQAKRRLAKRLENRFGHHLQRFKPATPVSSDDAMPIGSAEEEEEYDYESDGVISATSSSEGDYDTANDEAYESSSFQTVVNFDESMPDNYAHVSDGLEAAVTGTGEDVPVGDLVNHNHN